MSTHAPGRTFAALQVRDFSLMWFGETISSLGDGVFTVALALVALHIGHRPVDLAYVMAARAVPSVIFALLGGVVTDRLPRRRTMISSDAVRATAAGVVAVMLAAGALYLWELIVMVAIFGAADAFFFPAFNAIIPELLDDQLLAQGNALSQMSNQLTQGLIGPALGGLIVAAIGYAWSFAVNAASFVVSGACLLAMRIRTTKVERHGTALADAMQGISYFRSQRWLVVSLFGAALANFVGMAPLTVLLPLLVRTTLHGSPLSLGLVFASGGAAGVVASLVVARVGSPRLFVTVLWVSYAVGGVAMAAMALAHNVVSVALINAVEAGTLIYGDVLWFSMVQRLVPREYMGRVSSLIFLTAFALGPFGILLGGVMATVVGVRPTLAIGGLISAALCVLVVASPGAREPERRVAVSVDHGEASAPH
jgi:MFS transporter, DHA3 family, tetracycline resistance protein